MEEQCTSSDVDWRSFLLILGKPGTGKTSNRHKCIKYCLENHLSVAIAVPTGTLACTYREKYEDSVTCDTLHGLFKFSCNEHEVSHINRNIAMFDIMFIDEVSKISESMFHHIINCIERVIRPPVVVMSGDFAQQQPIATVNAHNTIV